MSDKYEIQWPLRVAPWSGNDGCDIADANGRFLVTFSPAHPDPKAAAEAEIERLTDEYGPAWSTDEEAYLNYKGSPVFSVGTCKRAESLVAHLNATGYRP